jgi:hypothetical protein
MDRFWKKVNKTPTCWEWTAGTKDGYGWYMLFPGKTEYAHRVAYTQLRGDIPKGKELDHLCRNRKCVNPDHLEPVSHAVNMNRSAGHRDLKTHCPYGHEFTPENTAVWKGNMRTCKICRAQRDRERRM